MTPELLSEFDRLTNRVSSPDQMERIQARLDLIKFAQKHGKAVCKVLFIELNKRNASEVKE